MLFGSVWRLFVVRYSSPTISNPEVAQLRLTPCAWRRLFLGMLCNVCGILRYSKSWKPSQWKAKQPEINRYNCCNYCNVDNFYKDIDEVEFYWDELVHVSWPKLRHSKSLKNHLFQAIACSGSDFVTRRNIPSIAAAGAGFSCGVPCCVA